MKKTTKKMIRKYDLEATEYINVISRLKVKIHNGRLKTKNYEIKREQLQQNRMFRKNASEF